MPSKAIPVVKVDKMTREVIAEYESLEQAETANGIPHGYMSRTCKDESLPKGRYYYRHKDGFDPNEDFTGKRNCPVVTFDTWEHRFDWYPSASECAKEMYLSLGTVSWALNGRLKLLLKRYAVKRMPVMFKPKGEE